MAEISTGDPQSRQSSSSRKLENKYGQCGLLVNHSTINFHH